MSIGLKGFDIFCWIFMVFRFPLLTSLLTLWCFAIIEFEEGVIVVRRYVVLLLLCFLFASHAFSLVTSGP